ncbi:response regulator transcription factor [Actinoallomurus rhizosphaericola]|uniref:response regulator transcription factor n=1 Tax=Actinoallomurus rhizosphaericola TaxID=2952536 RepID=UPI002091B523|nr:response regulator transcription factor [Actinoallomurus rhizosphaericola]MCO5992586.1 response regulator transcription factor [Actinoallomurus rhizosphaericola]
MRVVLAEDSVLLREGLIQILGRFGHETTAVGDAPALVAAVAADRPDIVVTDVRMPPGHRDEGLRAALELRRDHPGLPVLVLSQYVERSYAADLLQTGGGVGYLLKDRVGDVAEFIDGLTRVAEGGTVIDPEVVRRLLSERHDGSPLRRLTDRERQVLELMAEGRSNGAIARRLVVTEAAVVKHVGSIFMKLDLPPAPDDHRRVLAVLAHLRG